MPATRDQQLATPPLTPTYLILSQVYVPDPASVGQHLADAAEELVRRGWRVVVITADRGYDDPSMRYPRRETRAGVEIIRVPFASLSKKKVRWRLVGGVLFLAQALMHAMFVRGLSAVLFSTSPPLCPLGAVILGFVRRVPIKYWVMDINPDQAVAIGKVKPDGIPARLMRWMNRLATRRSMDVVVLDRFMAERVRRFNPDAPITILPPWPHEQALDNVDHSDNPFRREHGLDGKFVIMFSGNHSIASPLTTLLQAALQVQDDDRFRFLFVGGGLGKREIEQAIARDRPRNIVSLPYQPLESLRYSLSAADVHVVTLGDSMVGIIHPCKVYGAMAVSRPVLFLGPSPSHIADLLDANQIGWHTAHGDVPGMLTLLRRLIETPASELRTSGDRAQSAIRRELSQDELCGRLCDVLERDVPHEQRQPPVPVAVGSGS